MDDQINELKKALQVAVNSGKTNDILQVCVFLPTTYGISYSSIGSRPVHTLGATFKHPVVQSGSLIYVFRCGLRPP